ncbi:MAG TPA: hypothetical protein VIQ54_30925 [Polyangia bacterium]|jgi:hypothetical protein
MRVWGTAGVSFVAFALAAGGCSSGMATPTLDVWGGIGIERMTLYEASSGFWWQDADLWSSNAVGVMTVSGNRLVANGGICGSVHYGDCTATFSPPVVEVSVPEFDAPPTIVRLARVNGALEVRDATDALIATLKPRAMGADIFFSDGRFIVKADWDDTEAHKLWITTVDGGLLGWTVGVVPPEIAALAFGYAFGGPDRVIAVPVAAALAWLR